MLKISDLLNHATTLTLSEEYEETKSGVDTPLLLDPQSLQNTDLDGLIQLVAERYPWLKIPIELMLIKHWSEARKFNQSQEKLESKLEIQIRESTEDLHQQMNNEFDERDKLISTIERALAEKDKQIQILHDKSSEA